MSDEEVGSLIYRGNTVSFIYDKVLALKASMGRARDSARIEGRKDRQPEVDDLNKRIADLEAQLAEERQKASDLEWQEDIEGVQATIFWNEIRKAREESGG